ncbi:ATG_C domain-containing protein/Chorein_N domain-containing protein [Cephalotus follicularis]|uniref:Autophagy-related protein 2 n=1 Tax=Cephalotus follicularis TaxID=3775 RepID=A0A1Q3BEH4_CEPFO|nr:ATG_C domain-containing protein/Chorein_N domain-containing protein [Cephalotus follicularis]
MFSPWNIAKSAEEMLSRWVLKRACKFLLKKKLGKLLLGDIDVDQLDVQLCQGIIQLSDIALNVDYLNTKLGASTSVILKEGSIRSLIIKMPWKYQGCQVEVDELELVLAPCTEYSLSAENEVSSSIPDGNNCTRNDSGKDSPEMADSAAKYTFDDVHEGVKMIAKMVKWFLTSFNVKIKNLIVAFDSFSENNVQKMGCLPTLVLRISEIECGSSVSEDANSYTDAKGGSFLGISRLTNFVKFQGAIIELLQLDNVDSQTCSLSALGTTVGKLSSECCPLDATIPIMTGIKGGFSGNLKLSIPWKNGSLDIRKVDIDVYVDPLQLRFQPSTIKWSLLSWETYKYLGKDSSDRMHYKSADSVGLNSALHCHPSTLIPDKTMLVDGRFSSELSSFTVQESMTEAMLPGSHLIPDWVPFSVNTNQKDSYTEEVDFGASIDQFFECFDGMRSSQSALGSSGMWNWTCSVFSAITAASTLASGSLHIPSEQQHVQTNLRATVASISVLFSFHDEDKKQLYDLKDNEINVCSDAHYLVAELRDIDVALQVCPQILKFEGTVKYIEVANYLHDGDDVTLGSNNGINSQTLLIQRLQAEVQGALPPFASIIEDPETDHIRELVAADYTLENLGHLVKTMLFRTSGITYCQFTSNSNTDGNLMASTSFSLKLPQFICWVNIFLINMLLDLLKEVRKSVELFDGRNGFSSEAFNQKHESSFGNLKSGSGPFVTTLSIKGSLRGSISIPNARVILCFPFNSSKDVGDNSSWERFIALDFSSPLNMGKGKFQDSIPISVSSLPKRYSSMAAASLHLNVGSVDIYLVTPACKIDVGSNSSCMQRQRFSVHNVLSVSNSSGCLSVISMLWQEGPVTGPWVAERAKSLVTLEESRGRNKFMGRGHEFATVTTVENFEDMHSQVRREIVFSSTNFLHVHLFPVTINLDSSHYGVFHGLLNEMLAGLSCVAGDEVSVKEESSVSQTSILVECDSVKILIRPDSKENINVSIQSELPGSWHRLKLNVKKFELLSVSNIGGIRSADFFWLSHGEGKLWGSVTAVPDQEFLLISCSNSTMKRGDGGGSNALSSWLAGSDIIHLWQPQSLQGLTSITVRCSTIVAVGGRLDWLDAISSFFSLPSSDIQQEGECGLQKGDLNASSESSFVLNLVDIGLSYEPHLKKLAAQNDILNPESFTTNGNEAMGEPYVACLLAASSLKLSNTTVPDSIDNTYKITVQDLGLLLSIVSEPEKLSGPYSVEYLREIGYVKVAQEALIEVILRTSCKRSLLWEVECSKSHISVETCHDTTSALIRLAAQIQQLFAPDVEESVVHLQTRWNNVQQAQERNELNDESRGLDTAPLTSGWHSSSVGLNSKSEMVGLMDEICEDAFHLNGNQICQFGSSESRFCMSLEESFLGDACSVSSETPVFCPDLSINGSVPRIGLESSQTSFLPASCFPEIVEGYCISELRSLSGLSVGGQSLHQICKSTSKNVVDEDLGRGRSGWYRGTPIKFVENHISEAIEQTSVKQFPESKFSSVDCAGADYQEVMGRVLFKNINVRWKMFAGSDWHQSRTNCEHLTHTRARDTTVCLELALMGLQFQYDVFPIGGIGVSKLSLSAQDFHLSDRSAAAPWKLVLGYYHSKDRPRDSNSKAFKLDLEAVRPDPLIPLEEYSRLCIALLPMLLHLHQSQLDFLISFFGAKSTSVDQSSGCHQDSGSSKLLASECNNVAGYIVAEALLPYFQKFDIWPILVRVDYSPSRVDLAALRGGKFVELVNLVPWKGVELQLKHVHAVGVYGWGSVCETIIGEWLEDISQNQIHKLLQGLPTIRSLVAVGTGAAKLVSLPVENYRKDHRVLKGMQRGTIAFLRSISLEAVGLGVHLAAGAHDILLQAEDILTSITPPVSWPVQGKSKTNARYDQPKDTQQGIQQAYQTLSDGLGKSASALVRTPLKQYQRGAGAGSALVTAVRAVPAAAIAPASACASAVHYTLLGIRNSLTMVDVCSLDPEHKKESMEKYLGPTHPCE